MLWWLRHCRRLNHSLPVFPVFFLSCLYEGHWMMDGGGHLCLGLSGTSLWCCPKPACWSNNKNDEAFNHLYLLYTLSARFPTIYMESEITPKCQCWSKRDIHCMYKRRWHSPCTLSSLRIKRSNQDLRKAHFYFLLLCSYRDDTCMYNNVCSNLIFSISLEDLPWLNK